MPSTDRWNRNRIPGILSARGTAVAVKTLQSRRCSQDVAVKAWRPKVKMRSLLAAFSGLMLFATSAAQANVAITIDKNSQEMTVAVDGVERYHWPVSTGIPLRATPTSIFPTFRLKQDIFSQDYY